ncbi:MAG: ATP-binding cassette domain-containing protein [Actinobacteria bacterium]|nr:ATP-binding cassette domain-containing protein [Actinomycetota bacterium]
MTGSTPLARLTDVSKDYHRGPETVHALRGVDLSIDFGELVGIVGPSGSGKTTLINVLCGWEHPDRGEVAWMGASPEMGRLLWDQIAVVPQRLGLLDELSLADNIGLPLMLSGQKTHARAGRVGEVVALLELDHLVDRRPRQVSLGEQQRTALARALVMSPRLVIADEPTGHQDAERETTVFDAFRAAVSTGASCLVATHSPRVIEQLDRVVEMEDGSIVGERT